MQQPQKRQGRGRAVLRIVGAIVFLLLFAYAVLAMAIMMFGRFLP